jgi:large subunit ribosomal protein L33
MVIFCALKEGFDMAKTNTVQINVTKKNARAQTGKLEFNKYDPVVRKHVVFKEAKIK